MQIALATDPVEQIQADALVVPVFEGREETRFGAGPLRASGEVTGKSGELTLLYNVPGVKATRVLLAGAGKPEKFDAAEARKLAGTALRFLKPKSIKTIVFAPEAAHATSDFLAAAVEGALLGDFEPDRHKTSNDKKSVDSFAVAVSASPESEGAIARGRIVAEATNFARDLVNEPGNLMKPMRIAEAARKMAAEQGLECEVLDQDAMQKLGMGSLLGVAIGSAEPPCLVVVRYRPAKAQGSGHLGLVGKGVTFDTGGISIKPAEGMEKMKYDMAGGAAMLGAMRALAQLKPAIPVTAFVPCVENMPGSRAQRPGDIVTAMSGRRSRS